MSSLKIVLEPPPRSQLQCYNFQLPALQQPSSIPRTFLDAISLREKVFVLEQGLVPLEYHVDATDGRSYHWVIYSPPSDLEPEGKPIGTLRLLPPPHRPHPLPGAKFFLPTGDVKVPVAAEVFSEEDRTAKREWKPDRKTTFHDGIEPYLQIGRLCVLKEWRGKGVADALVQEACRWAWENWGLIEEGGGHSERRWKGLVLVHARDSVVRMWERNGFVVDEGVGTWEEVGVKLVGMFRRVEVKER